MVNHSQGKMLNLTMKFHYDDLVSTKFVTNIYALKVLKREKQTINRNCLSSVKF